MRPLLAVLLALPLVAHADAALPHGGAGGHGGTPTLDRCAALLARVRDEAPHVDPAFRLYRLTLDVTPRGPTLAVADKDEHLLARATVERGEATPGARWIAPKPEILRHVVAEQRGRAGLLARFLVDDLPPPEIDALRALVRAALDACLDGR